MTARAQAAKKKAAYWRGRFEALAQEYAIAMAQRVAELEAELADDDGGAGACGCERGRGQRGGGVGPRTPHPRRSDAASIR